MKLLIFIAACDDNFPALHQNANSQKIKKISLFQTQFQMFLSIQMVERERQTGVSRNRQKKREMKPYLRSFINDVTQTCIF